MSEDFDAGALAAQAVGEPTDADGSEPSPDGAASLEDGSPDANGDARSATVDDGGGESPLAQLRERLLATEPNIPLDSEELSTFDAERGGLARVKRGLYKALGVDGATAIEDIGLGLVEEFGAGRADGGEASEAGDVTDGDPGPLAGGGV